MDTRRPGSELADRRDRERATRRRGLVLGLCVWLVASTVAWGEAAEGPSIGPAPVVVPALLGASAEELRARFGEALRSVEIAVADSTLEQILESTRTATAELPPTGPPAQRQVRLERQASGDVRRVEYDLSEDRVYRVRWQLAERFERPLMNDLVERIATRLGKPDYDQTLRAKPGSGRADLRRTGWTLDGRALEIRQLHPFTGGPMFLSLGDREALQAIVDGRGIPLPRPETTGAWWRRPQRPPVLLTPPERRELVEAVDALVAKLANPPP